MWNAYVQAAVVAEGWASAGLNVGGLGVAGVGPIRVACFLSLAVCAALCQQREEQRAWDALPDAPSFQASTNPRDFQEPVHITVSSITRYSVSELGYNGETPQPEASDFLAKHLYSALLRRNSNYHLSTSGSLMGRATYAASRIFITRDDSGRERLNTSYFLGVLGSAIAHTAYRPYWNRPVAAPFSDFGSTIGNDAGMNFLHEFGPGLQHLMKGHAPKFVARVEERIEKR